jgi:hypothetical protein
MNRTTALAVSLALILSACIPAIPFPQLTTATPQVDDSSPSSTAEPATALVVTEVESPTATGSPTTSTTPEPTTTLSETMVVETQDSGTLTAIADTQAAPSLQTVEALTATVSPTSTASNDFNSSPLATETLHARFFGTLPPSIPYGKIWLKNKAKAEVYISMQCITIGGYKTILEYPVGSPARVSAPAGKYSYVVWVGGRQILGAFALDSQEELTITIYKNRVTVKN